MIIIGDSLLPFSPLVAVGSKEELAGVENHSIALLDVECFEARMKLGKIAQNKGVPFATMIEDEKALLYFANIGAKYLLTSDAKKIEVYQGIADGYLLDAKLLFVSEEFESALAIMGIDGIIYAEYLRGVLARRG